VTWAFIANFLIRPNLLKFIKEGWHFA
jgi:hypothetical protein